MYIIYIYILVTVIVLKILNSYSSENIIQAFNN